MSTIARRLERIVQSALDWWPICDNRQIYAPIRDLDDARLAIDEMEAALLTALPYVESEQDNPAYKPGAVAAVVKKMRAAIERAAA